MVKHKQWHWALILGVFVVAYLFVARSAAMGLAGIAT
jgi:hypothetical protein